MVFRYFVFLLLWLDKLSVPPLLVHLSQVVFVTSIQWLRYKISPVFFISFTLLYSSLLDLDWTRWGEVVMNHNVFFKDYNNFPIKKKFDMEASSQSFHKYNKSKRKSTWWCRNNRKGFVIHYEKWVLTNQTILLFSFAVCRQSLYRT